MGRRGGRGRERGRESKKKRESVKEREYLPSVGSFPKTLYHPARPKHGAQNSILVSHAGGRGPNTCTAFYCLP